MGLGLDVSKIPELTVYGDELGRKILNDETDAQAMRVERERLPV